MYLSRLPLPRSSALRASTRGLKNDDPSGAAPLRDRPAGELMRFTRRLPHTESQAGSTLAGWHPGRGAPAGVKEEAARHPGRGARRLARMSRGADPKTPGYRWIPYPLRPRQGVALIAEEVRHPGGVVYLSWHPIPGSSALRASTPGLKSDDPSGAAPLAGSLQTESEWWGGGRKRGYTHRRCTLCEI